jgi:DNA-binding response OmpR family regulator
MNTRILVIDDESVLASLYKQAFEASNILCDYASSGEAGLLQAQNLPPSLILLDVMMPGMDGLEVLTKIKSETKLKDIPIILLTNLSSGPIEVSAREKGAIDIWNKSALKPREIVDKVKQLLQIP